MRCSLKNSGVAGVASSRIAMTSAVGIAATSGGLRQPALDHDAGGVKELAEECALPTHILMLGISDGPVKQKCTFEQGIYS